MENPIKIGGRLSHYQILEKIGEGGMGVVYRALDTRLLRHVAIKILPAQAGIEDKKRRRFIHEARAASALNHPGICQVYDIGTDHGLQFIVMEVVEGKTLRQTMDEKKSLTDGEVLDIGIQVCDALSAAHARGIIHRDIKPENIMITEDGIIKVMDFGLAKLKADPPEMPEPRKATPAALSPLTSMSTFLGTAAYMSPEQIEKKQVDERTDIFSLGIVLYQAFTGTQPFHGFNTVLLMKSIVRDDPEPPSQYLHDKRTTWDDVILKSLAKDPASRYQSMPDFQADLENLRDRPRRKRLRRMLWGAAAVLALILGVAVTGLNRWIRTVTGLNSGGNRGIELKPVAASSELEHYPTFMPDGQRILYSSFAHGSGFVAFSNLMMMDLETEKSQICLNDKIVIHADVSPDGSRIVYALGGRRNPYDLYISDITGQHPRKIEASGCRPRWSPEGNRIAYSTDVTGHVGMESAVFLYDTRDDGARRISPENGLMFHDPDWSPNGRWIVTVSGVGSVFELWLIDLSTGEARPLSDYGAWLKWPVFSPDGRHIYFISNQNGYFDLWRVAFDCVSGKINTDPVQLTHGLEIESMDISPDGRKLVFGRTDHDHRIIKMAFSEGTNRPIETWIILSNLEAVENIEVSPDRSSMIVETFIDGSRSLFLFSFPDSTGTVLYDEQPAFSPSWSHDGRWIAFDAGGGDHADIYRIPASGGQAEKIIDHPGADWMPSCSPDGRHLCFLSNRSGRFELWVNDLLAGKNERITDTPDLKTRGFWSHDGRRIAYCRRRSGADSTDIVLYDLDTKSNNTISRFFEPLYGFHFNTILRWNRDDSSLYYAHIDQGAGWIVSVSVENGENRPFVQLDRETFRQRFDFSENHVFFVCDYGNTDIWMAEGMEE